MNCLLPPAINIIAAHALAAFQNGDAGSLGDVDIAELTVQHNGAIFKVELYCTVEEIKTGVEAPNVVKFPGRKG